MKRLINKDVPFITYIIHDKNMKNGRTVTVYKPTQEYYILFELIKFRRLPATFPDIGITVISEGLEPSPSDVSTTQDVLTGVKTPSSIENTNPDYYKQELARIAELEAEVTKCHELQDSYCDRIAELEAAQRWIPVGERLPEERQNVLALDRTGTAYHWEYSKCLSNIFVGYYTHWMPLPEPPEVKE